MKTYNVIFNEGVDDGVFAISVVKSPAMESNFITLKEQKKIELTEVDSKKYILAGVVLVPDKEVYRNQGGEEFNIKFSQDTIEDVANNFIKRGYQQNSSIEHETKIDGVSIVQSWVVKDPKNDTANAYGLPKEDIKEGSWIVLYKCDNKDIYDKAINGEIKGFSIDGLFSLEEVKLKTEVKMSDEIKDANSKLDWLVNLFKTKEADEPAKIELGTATTKDGAVIEFMGDVPEAGTDVFIVNGDERVALAVGEYPLADLGVILVVTEDGKIAEVKPMEAEAPAELNNEPATAQPTQGEIEQMIKSVLVKYSEESLKDLETKLSEQKESFTTELSKVNEELETLKKQPAAVSLASAPKAPKKYEEMSNREKMEYNRSL